MYFGDVDRAILIIGSFFFFSACVYVKSDGIWVWSFLTFLLELELLRIFFGWLVWFEIRTIFVPLFI